MPKSINALPAENTFCQTVILNSGPALFIMVNYRLAHYLRLLNFRIVFYNCIKCSDCDSKFCSDK